MVRMVTETAARGARDPGDPAGVVRGVRALLLGAAGVLLSGCATPYLLQAASGEWQLLHRRVPIDSLLADPRTPPALRGHLEVVRAAREFAVRELHLPDNASYRSYADIGRPYVVWNVVAAPEFSAEPKRWCFPVAGCVAYRGYFHERRAREFAAALAVRGFDVAVDGVPAYSTLGRFADPVLSSMLGYGDDELAATIFHELAHQLLYVPDDSQFNEAFASTVEDEGLERWLRHLGAGERLRQLRERDADAAAFADLMAQAHSRLARLYASGAPRVEMRARKAEVLAGLAGKMRALEQRLRDDAESAATVVAAYGIDRERAEVVECKGLPGQHAHHQALQPRDRIGQRHDPAGQTRNPGRQAHDLLERHDLGAAQLVDLTGAGVHAERAQERFGDVVHADRCEARPRARQRHNARREAQQLREAVGESVPGSEDHRGTEARHPGLGAGRLGMRRGAQPRFRGRLGAQVTARGLAVRAERAHVQHAPHRRRACRRHHLGGELGVHHVEARAAARIQDADEIDDRVAAGEQLAQYAPLVHIRDRELHRVEHAQLLGAG